MNCLVIKNDGIGDLIYCSGILSKLAEHFNGQLDLVTCRENKEIVELISGIRNVYYVSRDSINFPHPRYKIHIPPIEPEDMSTLLRLTKENYDTAICLRRFIRQSSLIIMNCINAENKRCCWQMPTNVPLEKAKEFTKGWYHYWGNERTLSELEYYNEFCNSFINWSSVYYTSLNFKMSKDALDNSEKSVAVGIGGHSVPPGAIWLNIIRLLVDEGWQVHLFGSILEKEFSDLIVKKVPSVINHVGKLSFEETLKKLAHFDYYIGCDSAISHIASTVIPKILVLLGGGTFLRFFPWPNRTGQFVIFYGMDCYDCSWVCKYKSRHCLELITPENVIESFKAIVDDKQDCRIINVGDKDILYQIAWRHSMEEDNNIMLRELDKKYKNETGQTND